MDLRDEGALGEEVNEVSHVLQQLRFHLTNSYRLSKFSSLFSEGRPPVSEDELPLSLALALAQRK